MKARGAWLSDPPLETWEPGFQGEIHAMALLADDQAPRLASALELLRASLDGVGLVVAEEAGATFRNEKGQAIEHFGFVDGISQPLFLRDDIESAGKDGNDCFDPSAPLVLALRPDLLGEGEHSHGSYLVFRKLEQDVRRFRDLERALADCLGIDSELASAYTVGRFRDGTPLTLHLEPNRAGGLNNFNFDVDPGGRCPVHAHIRRTNPRGSAAASDYSSPELERQHRIVRRGISYGVLDLNPPAEEKVGLLFMCFQGDIAEQFEMMQSSWVNSADFLGAGSGIDPIAGQGQLLSGGQRWPMQWGDNDQHKQFDFSSCVALRGGEYFFAPSLSFANVLSADLFLIRAGFLQHGPGHLAGTGARF
jgi:Dyp-type peroxidase family